MHPNKIFRGTPADRNAHFARDRAFGVLSMNVVDGPLLAHVPFLLSPGAKIAHLHLFRSNPIARATTEPQPCVIAVSGPDSYISPDWYGVPYQVPTWNYIAVHLWGHVASDGARRVAPNAGPSIRSLRRTTDPQNPMDHIENDGWGDGPDDARDCAL